MALQHWSWPNLSATFWKAKNVGFFKFACEELQSSVIELKTSLTRTIVCRKKKLILFFSILLIAGRFDLKRCDHLCSYSVPPCRLVLLS